jgi:UDP-2,3-diacylglucosamine pyrophosphatase LpxH
MKRVILSDLHAGWDKSNTEEFIDFIEYASNSDIDEIVLAGDIFDMWRQGISTVFIEFSNVVSKIRKASVTGTNVVMIPGNHDWRLAETDESLFSIRPWKTKTQHRFTSGGEKFVVIHGHLHDPVNGNSRQNEALCVTDDETASAMDSFWNKIVSRSVAFDLLSPRQPLLTRPSIRSLEHLSDPGVLSKDNGKNIKDAIVERIKREYDDYVIFGHTHLPEKQATYANCGSWTAKENTYIVVEEGEVELKRWSGGG